IALHDVVASAVDELRFLRPGSTIVHVREGVGSCSADPARLSQLLGNLVSNAVAYGDPAVPITVTSVIGPPCAISVHNAGSPIPKELQPQLFEPMTRGDHGHKGRSVGLGLFIVREIMRAHGGEATVTSTDAGTTITVRWPGT
ncbi:MAG TPA: HAMP domain-containing sensor histidine kinase, partial [Kofleriaceae bacterium]